MSLESATYINQLNVLNPTGTDMVSTADDHIKLIKSTLKNTFPNITGPVNISQAQLNSNSFLTDTGTANTVVLTPSPAWTSYAAGTGFMFKAANNSTATAVTVNVNSLGATPLVTADGNPAVIYSNAVYSAIYNGTAFVLVNSVSKKVITDSVTYTPATLTKTLILGSSALGLGANSIEYLTINTSGQVGIGTTAPAYNLDVVGNARIQNGTTEADIYLGPQTNPGVVYGTTLAMGFNAPTVGASINVSKDTTNKFIDINAGTTSSKINFTTGGTKTAELNTNGQLGLGYFTGNGKINITSTDTPSAGYASLLELKNSSATATNPFKLIRMTANGDLEIRNSANTASILSLSDAGVLTLQNGLAASSISAGTLQSSVVGTTATLNDSSTKLATTAFVNPGSTSNYFTFPDGRIMLTFSAIIASHVSTTFTTSTYGLNTVGKTLTIFSTVCNTGGATSYLPANIASQDSLSFIAYNPNAGSNMFNFLVMIK